jgi:hypothetical protein
MELSKLWKVGVVAAVTATVALVAAACSGTTTITETTTAAAPPASTMTSTKTAQGLILQADAVMGAAGAPSPQEICVESSQFQPGEDVVFRVKVFDPATGKAMDDKVLTSVVVALQDGQTFNAVYGGHPQPPATDYFWSAAWTIPADYPSGSVPYTVTATSQDGRTGTFSQFNVGPSLLTVVAAQPPTARTLVVDANTVIGSAGVINPQDICVGSTRFPQGEEVVWQIKVYDPASGETMDDQALDSVVVSLADGQTFDAVYGPHPGAPPGQPQPPATDHFWTAGWSIPADYPTGSAPFAVTATSQDGRTGTFSEFNVAPALLTVVAAQ